MDFSDEAHKLARRLAVDDNDHSEMHMIECGLHSGLPPCCVSFFVKMWWPYTLAVNALSAREQANAVVAYDAYQAWTTRPGYIPCPNCVIDRRFVHILACDCESGRLPQRGSTRGRRRRWS